MGLTQHWYQPMSKTQEKRARRLAEQQAFLKERRETQLTVFEYNFNVGLKLFEDNRDKMSEEEIQAIEKEIEENRALIDKLRREIDGPVIPNSKT